MSEWFDPTVNVKLMHPYEVMPGMRLAREKKGADGQRYTELTPVWDMSTGPGLTSYSYSMLFRTSDGKVHSASSSDRVWVDPEITDGTRPPGPGIWITNQRFDENAGMVGDRYFYERSRMIDHWVCADSGRVYRLLYGHSRRNEDTGPGERWSCFWVCRWDRGVKWLGPSRGAKSLVEEQFEQIRGGQAW